VPVPRGRPLTVAALSLGGRRNYHGGKRGESISAFTPRRPGRRAGNAGSSVTVVWKDARWSSPTCRLPGGAPCRGTRPVGHAQAVRAVDAAERGALEVRARAPSRSGRARRARRNRRCAPSRGAHSVSRRRTSGPSGVVRVQSGRPRQSEAARDHSAIRWRSLNEWPRHGCGPKRAGWQRLPRGHGTRARCGRPHTRVKELEALAPAFCP
jgi:hypothetical protein